jgi:Leucine-rich repeat (LRR) protein
MSSEVVLSRPTAELAVVSAKYVKECTELHLANKGITELDGFQPFVNLEVLWINGNRLECVGLFNTMGCVVAYACRDGHFTPAACYARLLLRARGLPPVMLGPLLILRHVDAVASCPHTALTNRYLDDLDDCVRLRSLYAHQNRINTLEGSLPALVNLQTLNLANNNISNLDAALVRQSVGDAVCKSLVVVVVVVVVIVVVVVVVVIVVIVVVGQSGWTSECAAG